MESCLMAILVSLYRLVANFGIGCTAVKYSVDP